LGNQKTEIETQ